MSDWAREDQPPMREREKRLKKAKETPYAFAKKSDTATNKSELDLYKLMCMISIFKLLPTVR